MHGSDPTNTDQQILRYRGRAGHARRYQYHGQSPRDRFSPGPFTAICNPTSADRPALQLPFLLCTDNDSISLTVESSPRSTSVTSPICPHRHGYYSAETTTPTEVTTVRQRNADQLGRHIIKGAVIVGAVALVAVGRLHVALSALATMAFASGHDRQFATAPALCTNTVTDCHQCRCG